MAAPAPDPRRMRELRLLALLSIALLGIVSLLQASLLPVFFCPFWLPYVLLWRRSPEGQRKALAWAVVAGCGALALSTSAVVVVPLSVSAVVLVLLGGSIPIVKPQASDYVALVAVALFVPTQVIVVWRAIRTFRAARRQPEEKLRVGRPLAWVIVFFGLVLLLLPFQGSRRIAGGEASAMATLRTLNTAQVYYLATYRSGFANTLAKLGPPAGGQPDANHVDFSYLRLYGVGPGSTSFVKAGYQFVYTPGAMDPQGRTRTYTMTARPIEYKQSGIRSFFTDQTGVIHATREDRAATARDEVLQ